ncbi:selenide, water dikinase SelD [Bradymonadaceae bacterium TMQ3]|uniref:Selenide, water dikinase n=1 Tax=Lujinxingia sediminis TaxID=2480984 RepID=A0ABY0CZJ8_9DELT|nr:selenide, water dikinase SelD [Lujinxingia sediminis]RDV40114.1 selenide, water dikinase SelD [Bradymonadaceae bacterium TMQ3]RVU48996.1 selenide, water dikinase SelD [Lujinxingia sediminis]TXC78289.1 selenide, water dikinase SelD [Bradymonadales bacterium TMQ1]
MSETIRLTQYSHGAGCGCKLSPAVLDRILANRVTTPDAMRRLLVGNSSRDDAGAMDLGDGRVLLSTTDFFMPIVDDPYEFGRIASANAISDIYAMGGDPVMAIAILGWPINVLSAEVAGDVMEGARSICAEAGVALAGGHSIDSPEPIFGLAVNGLVDLAHLQRNDAGQVGDTLFLTKALGVGILSTAEKKGVLRQEDRGLAAASMMQLNKVGATLAKIEGVHAMTDVTGFGLLGHLSEMCAGAGVNARVALGAVRQLTDLSYYLDAGAIPGGTGRNWESYGHHVVDPGERVRQILCDPQTSGGLLVAVAPEAVEAVQRALVDAGLHAHQEPIGELVARPGEGAHIQVEV